MKPFKLKLSFKTTCFTRYFSNLNAKGEDSSYKIDGFMATYTSKLEWAWLSDFLSLTLLILKINTTYDFACNSGSS